MTDTPPPDTTAWPPPEMVEDLMDLVERYAQEFRDYVDDGRPFPLSFYEAQEAVRAALTAALTGGRWSSEEREAAIERVAASPIVEDYCAPADLALIREGSQP